MYQNWQYNGKKYNNLISSDQKVQINDVLLDVLMIKNPEINV